MNGLNHLGSCLKKPFVPCLAQRWAGRILLAAFTLCPVLAQADDVLVLYRREVNASKVLHVDLVLTEALRRTLPKYGNYHIELYTEPLVRERLLVEMIKGDRVNTAVVATQPTWEANTLPVWIPVDMGLSSYRIGLVKRTGQARLSAVRNETDLKTLTVGVGQGWSSRQVFEANGFQLELATDQTALTKMLLAERLDYFPRGVNEVFVEFDALTASNPDLAIESDLVLDFPLPTYIFVSPRTPRLAKRLTEGMESMVRDGTLLNMVKTYHADMLRRANLCARRVIRMQNPFLSTNNPIGRAELWFNPYDKKRGICNASDIMADRTAVPKQVKSESGKPGKP